MPTPIQWLAATQSNTGIAALNNEIQPQIIGLSNGNFLVAWVENGTTGIGTSPGTDIVGKIYDPLGNVVVDSFHINGAGFYLDNEADFSIAATNDGGFVMVYADYSISNVDSTQLIWSRHNSAGVQTDTAFVAFESVPADFLANPQVSVNLLTNESYVSYTDYVGGDTDLNGVIVSATGTVGSEFAMGFNGNFYDGEGVIAVLTGGNVVSLYREDTGGAHRVAFRLTDSAGALIANPIISTTDTIQLEVAALSDGNFVTVWAEGDNIVYRVYNSVGVPVTSLLSAAGTVDLENEPRVVGLPQGGFAIVWDNDTTDTLQAQLFTNAGVADGSVVNFGSSPAQPDIGVTADGRLLVTWVGSSGSGEIFHSIWDPRASVIYVSQYDNASRSFVNNTGPVTGNVFSNAYGNLFIGVAAATEMIGSRNGDLFIETGGVNGDILNGGEGIDRADYSSVEFADTVIVDLGLGTITNPGDIAEQLISIEDYYGGGSETIIGSNAGNELRGGIGNNVISGLGGDDYILGLAGNDIIEGGSGIDTVNGGDGDDTINFSLGNYNDNIDGGAGNDTLNATNGYEAIYVDLLTGTYAGFGGLFTIAGIETIIGTALDDVLINNDTPGNVLQGGDGNDTIHSGLNAFETLDGGNGIDTLNTSSYDGAYTIDLATGTTEYGEIITNFENLISGNGNDTVTGTTDANNIQTNDGDDIINAGDGGDIVDGGGGNDFLNGESGNDVLIGGAGNDVIDGGFDGDQMFGGDGDDVIFSDTVGDVVDGGAGRDLVDFSLVSGVPGATNYWSIGSGYRGNTNFSAPVAIAFIDIEDFYGLNTDDQVQGTAVANQINGAGGNDGLRGFAGDDTLNGDDGDDFLDGGTGADVMNGGAGNDIFYVDSFSDTVTEGLAGGTDEVRTTVSSYILGDNVENLRLQGPAVVGTGNALNNTINAGAGPALLYGLAGNDILNGSGSGDTLDGGSGDDFIYGRNGNDTLFGWFGNDTMRGQTGSDTMYGEEGNDLLFGDEGQDQLYGGGGDDDLRGGIQNDVIYGDAGSDQLRGEDGNDTLYGGSGRDFFTGGAGNDNFYLEEGDFVGTGLTLATADRIVDFQDGFDRIRLNLLDANTLVAGDQAFTFIGSSAFTNVAGQLRYQISGSNTLVFGDTNGDGVADFAIALTGAYALDITDFGL